MFKNVEKIGEGAFGTVYRAFDCSRGHRVALKKLRLRDVRVLPPTVVRELSALRHIAHANVMTLLDYHVRSSSLVLVLPYLPHNLGELLSRMDMPLLEAHAQRLARMLIAGLAALHAGRLLHRDIKPTNLLLSHEGVLKIADMGQARLRPAHEDASLSHAVATRWYRAPELLFGSRRYGYEVDIWAAGCVIAQLINSTPLMAGDSDIDQLFRVITLLGTPTPQSWRGLDSLPDYHKLELPACSAIPLQRCLPHSSTALVRLLAHMLRWDPKQRPSAAEALRCEWMLLASSQPLHLPPHDVIRAPVAEDAMPDALVRGRDQQVRPAAAALATIPPGRPVSVNSGGRQTARLPLFPAKGCSAVTALPGTAAAVRRELHRARALMRGL